jgi:hypothetical protein
MAQRNERSFSVWGVVYNILTIPCNFISGFVVGLAAPVAVIAAIVSGVRLLTGKVLFLSPVEDEQGEKRLHLHLVPADQAGDLFREQKEKIGTDLGSLRDEIRAVIEEARADAVSSQQESEAPPA